MKDTNRLYEDLRGKLALELSNLRHVSDEALYEMIDREIALAERGATLTVREKLTLRSSLFNAFRRLDILQELVDTKEITEIMVNGKDHIFVEKNGRVVRWDRSFRSNEQLEDMIQQIVSRVNRVVNVSSPIADARLEDGSRVHVVLPPVSLGGPVVTIRKFPDPITMEKLIGYGSVTPEAAAFLKKLVKAGYNIFISGGTNSGKTTFLNALSSFIPDEERVITIEDSAELQLTHIRNLVRLETRSANTEGEGAVTISDLIRASLRMNPDRIVVGEVRGGEALDMLQAMNTGHDGSLSTGHANSPRDMLSRLETMVLCAAELPLAAIRSQIAGALDLMIHLGRLRDHSRHVLSITEVGDCINGEIQLNELFSFQEQKASGRRGRVEGSLVRTGELKNKAKLLAAGIDL
ncbi:MAG: CpaF family protein [Stomatobaculum sp.]|nr:CpaF family protein [Stomatobaculum sp.]